MYLFLYYKRGVYAYERTVIRLVSLVSKMFHP